MVLEQPSGGGQHYQLPAVGIRPTNIRCSVKPSKLLHQHRNSRHYKSSTILNAPNDDDGCPTSSSASNTNNNTQNAVTIPTNVAVPTAFPRLANALKSLISSAGGITTSAFSKSSKPAFVDAGDEVIYYSNAVINPSTVAKSSQNGGGENAMGGSDLARDILVDDTKNEEGEQQRQWNAQRGEMARKRSPSLARMENHYWKLDDLRRDSPPPPDDEQQQHFAPFASSSSSHYFSHRQPTTLEQIRQLYKSVPNFNNFEGEEEENGGVDMEEYDQQQDEWEFERRRGKAWGAISPIGGCVPRKERQQQRDWQNAIFGRKFEDRLGRLCPLPIASKSHHQLPPPLQQPQRKRLLLLQPRHGDDANNGGDGDDDNAAAANANDGNGNLPPCSCGTPITSNSISSCSGASSLSSSGGNSNSSSRSVPTATTSAAKWTAPARPPSFPTIEKVCEQYEKCVRMPTMASKLDASSISSSPSPHDSLASCSLGSSAGIKSRAIGSNGKEQRGREKGSNNNDSSRNGRTQQPAATTTKCSPTDSGYRSRGETPRNGGHIVGNAAAAKIGVSGGGRRPRPMSMLEIAGLGISSNDNNKGGGKAAEMERMKRRGAAAGEGGGRGMMMVGQQRENDENVEANQFAAASLQQCLVHNNNNNINHRHVKPQCCAFPRKYIWMETVPPAHHQTTAIHKMPFNAADFAAAIANELEAPICTNRAEMEQQLAMQLCKEFGHFLQQLRVELRRLSGVLVKLTARDIASAVMLLFPPELAWHCLESATSTVKRSCQNGTSELAQQRQQRAKSSTASINEGSGLRHMNAGRFLQWMWDNRVAAILDAKTAILVAAIFDWLFCEFLDVLKTDTHTQPVAHWVAQLSASPSSTQQSSASHSSPASLFSASVLLRALCQSRPITKCYHLLGTSTTTSSGSLANLVRNVPLHKLLFTGQFPTIEAEIFPGNFDTLAIDDCDEQALLILHYLLEKSSDNVAIGGAGHEQLLEQWLRRATIFAIHRHANRVQAMDIMQAARLLLPDFDCVPPLCAQQMFQHSPTASNVFCQATKAILTGQMMKQQQQQQHGNNNNSAVTSPTTTLVNNAFAEFDGWSPLCWAIALENDQIVEEMLRTPNASREVRQSELPLQICAQTGNLPIGELLLSHGANPFRSSTTKNGNITTALAFDSGIRTAIFPFPSSPIAISAARGDLPMVRLFIGCLSALRRNSSLQLMLLMKNEQATTGERMNEAAVDECKLLPLDSTKFALLTESEKRALTEALEWAASANRIALMLQLIEAGIPWPSAKLWLNTLKQLMMSNANGEECPEQQKEQQQQRWAKHLAQLLNGFEPRMARELHNMAESCETLVELLFQLLNSTLHNNNDDDDDDHKRLQQLAARILSIQFQQIQSGSLSHLEREFAAYFPAYVQQQQPAQKQQQQNWPPNQLQIDPKFVNCPELSDIRFRFADGQLVFAHRIVLVNASEQFKQMLQSPSGVVDVPNASADTFRLLLEFVYGNASKCVTQLGKWSADRQVEMLELVDRFGVDKLAEIGQRTIGNGLTMARFATIYSFAKRRMEHTKKQQPQQSLTKTAGAEYGTLMEECVRFAIGNLPELLVAAAVAIESGDDAVDQAGDLWWRDLLARMETQFQMAIRESKLL